MPDEPRFYLTKFQEASIQANLANAAVKSPVLPAILLISQEILRDFETYKPGKRLHWAYILGLEVWVDPHAKGRMCVLAAQAPHAKCFKVGGG